MFSDHQTTDGHGLGAKTTLETLEYSVVAAIQVFWLAARARNLGVGWISILDPLAVSTTLDLSSDWKLVAYLCLGYPQQEQTGPELVRHNWQDRRKLEELVLHR